MNVTRPIPAIGPKKMKSKDLTSSKSRSCKLSVSSATKKGADSSNRPKLSSSCLSPVFSIDLAGDGKLGYGFISADELEEIDIGPGDKPRPTFISKKKDGRWRIAIDFRDPNRATPKRTISCNWCQ